MTTPTEPDPTPKSRVIVKRHGKRDLMIALVVAAAILGFILFAILSFEKEVGGLRQPGTVVEKVFIPWENPEFTLHGNRGVSREEGTCILQVKLDRSGEIYNVYVDGATYRRFEVGDRYSVPVGEPETRTVVDKPADDGLQKPASSP